LFVFYFFLIVVLLQSPTYLKQ